MATSSAVLPAAQLAALPIRPAATPPQGVTGAAPAVGDLAAPAPRRDLSRPRSSAADAPPTASRPLARALGRTAAASGPPPPAAPVSGAAPVADASSAAVQQISKRAAQAAAGLAGVGAAAARRISEAAGQAAQALAAQQAAARKVDAVRAGSDPPPHGSPAASPTSGDAPATRLAALTAAVAALEARSAERATADRRLLALLDAREAPPAGATADGPPASPTRPRRNAIGSAVAPLALAAAVAPAALPEHAAGLRAKVANAEAARDDVRRGQGAVSRATDSLARAKATVPPSGVPGAGGAVAITGQPVIGAHRASPTSGQPAPAGPVIGAHRSGPPSPPPAAAPPGPVIGAHRQPPSSDGAQAAAGAASKAQESAEEAEDALAETNQTLEDAQDTLAQAQATLRKAEASLAESTAASARADAELAASYAALGRAKTSGLAAGGAAGAVALLPRAIERRPSRRRTTTLRSASWVTIAPRPCDAR